MSAANLVRYNARRCEAANDPQCRCRCGGAMHGKPHGEQWIQAQIKTLREEQLEREAAARKQGELPLSHYGQPRER